jgi:hypothetical protein
MINKQDVDLDDLNTPKSDNKPKKSALIEKALQLQVQSANANAQEAGIKRESSQKESLPDKTPEFK